MPQDLTRQYELLQRRNIKQFAKLIRQIYEQAILEISAMAAGVRLKDKPFSLSLYPALDRQLQLTMNKMQREIYQQILRSVEQSWALANQKNNIIIDKRLAGKIPAPKGRQILYDPNKEAYDAFITRKEKGLNLSQRVWKTVDPFKKEMEQALGLSMNKGRSATKMATELKSYLNEPDKLFRRVRNNEGKLVLSRAAREYHPGPGVYRSSYKNALRLSRTENNIAFRTADFERWQKMPFVTGIEVHTSANHPHFDICDTLQGRYPKDFKFTGWHPQCICYQTPVMMNDEEYDKIEDQILAGEAINVPKQIIVAKPPKSFTKYLSDNEERIAGWKTKPYWLKDNKKYVK